MQAKMKIKQREWKLQTISKVKNANQVGDSKRRSTEGQF